MAHDPNSIPKLLKRNPDLAFNIELVDENGRHVTSLPFMLRDGSSNYESYPHGVIRTTEAMVNIADTIIMRYNAGSGSIIDKESLMLCQHVGKATNPELGDFDMIVSMDFSPMIESEKTGKKFRLSWQQILELAIAAGIAQEDD
ncbi:hypothetical protein Phage2-1_00109 [Achromobacter phage 2-1]|nr:hypothetical protein Phage2-1_00109 [Achromobacter phage 2-1]